jgi:NSS family neurotransmitter:Na+ symporter
MSTKINDGWNTRLGVILAVSGSAVGLGNFLRFPGLVAEYGGGAFMIAYFISFLLIGLPICWAEWTIGRKGGLLGFNSAPGIFQSVTNNEKYKYLGVIALIIPVGIYFYYLIIESWCLAYAFNYFTGNINFQSPDEASAFFQELTGISENGSAISLSTNHVFVFVLVSLAFNFFFISRGISRGIEKFCSIAMPTLLMISIIILIRVLTLGTPNSEYPENNINNGLGYMWNPSFESLKNPSLWLAAASQIFFSLSVGFGVIITYASYLKESDDVVLSGLTAASTNEFFEVSIGGMMSIPAAVAFFGVTGLTQIGLSTFNIGFNALPLVFAEMPLGNLFGFLFFFLLFLAAITSSLSMLQPALAFIKDSLRLSHRKAISILFFITTLGAYFVLFNSKDLKALDTLDYWIANLLMVFLATAQIILFGWKIGIKKGLEYAHKGSKIKIPVFYNFIIKYITPTLLIIILFNWIWGIVNLGNPNQYIIDLFIEPNLTAWNSIGLIFILGLIITFCLNASKRITK